MEFVIKTPAGDPAAVAAISPEIIANQRVGSRIEFKAPHDLTVEFADGAVVVDDIDLIVYIVPDEYFCYRGDAFVLKFILGCRKVLIDHRPPIGAVNAQAIIAAFA